jgi:hypothetical protein
MAAKKVMTTNTSTHDIKVLNMLITPSVGICVFVFTYYYFKR